MAHLQPSEPPPILYDHHHVEELGLSKALSPAPLRLRDAPELLVDILDQTNSPLPLTARTMFAGEGQRLIKLRRKLAQSAEVKERSRSL
jgi:hypothetical protein